MNSKKIMIIANDTSYTYNLRKEIMKEFVKNGNDVVVVAKKDKYYEEIETIGVRNINIDIPRHGTNPFSDLKLYLNIYRAIKNYNPDIVFSYNIKPNVYGGLACKLLNIPFIPNITGLGGALMNGGMIQRITKGLYKLGLAGANEVLFQNQYNKNYFINKKIINNQKKSYILPGSGIDTDKIVSKKYPKDDETIRFLTVCRIMKDKGIDELLNSIKHIKKTYGNKVEFCLAGNFEDISYKKIIQDMVKMDYIKYLGHVNNVPNLMERYHCIIHPSYHEGLSNILLEAGAVARPVIASDIPGCIETFIDKESGLAVKSKDSEDLSKKIEKFINMSHEKKVMMGKANREHIEKNFDRKIVVEKYIECIDKYAK